MTNTNREHEIRIEHDVNVHFEDKKRSIHFFWFMWGIYAVVSMTKNCFSAAIADIVEEGFMSKSQTELITAMFYVVYTPLQVLGGICSDKFSPERLIKIGLVGGSLANAVIFFFNTFSTDIAVIYPAMMVSWIFNAIVQFAIWASIFKVVSSQCVRSDRPKMIFLISFSPSMGFFLSYALGAILPDWRMNFSISAVSLLALAVILHFWDRHVNKYMKWDKEVPTVNIPGEKKSSVSTLKLFLESGFILLLVCIFLRDSVTASVRRIASSLLREEFSLDPSLGNLMSVLIVSVSMLGIFVAKEMLLHNVLKNHLVGIVIGLGATTLVAVLFIFAPNIATNVICMCLIAGITTATGLFSNTISSAFVKYGRNATAAGLANAAVSLGFIAPLIAVMIQENTESWVAVKIAIAIAAAASVIIALLVLPLYNRFKKKEAE
ncbi:MAG: MFS transporter [Clostridia bacterium]|nr:MFS transporter [Clostridia bacterium]